MWAAGLFKALGNHAASILLPDLQQIAAILPVLPVAVFVGGAIGLTGIGGVLMVPLLVYYAGLDVRDAVPASLAAFVFTGVAGSWLQSRAIGGATRPHVALMATAGLGAIGGVWLVERSDSAWPLTILALFTILSGLAGVWMKPALTTQRSLDTSAAAALGAPVGLFSALTGTGGPVVLVPVLMMMRLPAHFIVTLAQFIQIPIGVMATLTAIALGRGSVVLALLLGPALALGALVGSWLHARVPAAGLHKLLSILLILFGVLTLLPRF